MYCSEVERAIPFLHQVPLHPPNNLRAQPCNVLRRVIASCRLACCPVSQQTAQSLPTILTRKSRASLTPPTPATRLTHPQRPSRRSHPPHAPARPHVSGHPKSDFPGPCPRARQAPDPRRPAAQSAPTAGRQCTRRSWACTFPVARSARTRIRFGGTRWPVEGRWS